MFRARNIWVPALTYVLRKFRGVSVRCCGNGSGFRSGGLT